MLKVSRSLAVLALSSLAFQASAFAEAAQGSQSPAAWRLLISGGPVVILMILTSIAAVASIIYHFQNVKPEKLTPREFTENLIFLLEKKEYQKAVSVCKQQENMVSAIALKGLSKISQGKATVESAIQYEGKARIEKMWQNLNYLGDIAVIAPMLGLLGTTLGMIDAFNFFKAGTLHPGMLTQGLAKAMINTALGLVIAVPCLVFYSYFRGRVSKITSDAETAAAEIMHTIAK